MCNSDNNLIYHQLRQYDILISQHLKLTTVLTVLSEYLVKKINHQH